MIDIIKFIEDLSLKGIDNLDSKSDELLHLIDLYKDNLLGKLLIDLKDQKDKVHHFVLICKYIEMTQEMSKEKVE